MVSRHLPTSRIVRGAARLPGARVLRRAWRLAGRGDLAALRTAYWALRARQRVRRQLLVGGLDAVRLPDPPAGSTGLDRTPVVHAVLRTVGASCLERALVRQRWYAGRRVSRVLVVGVTAPSDGFHAHAWLDGDPDDAPDGMVELLRRPPPPAWLEV